ncbi:hypothetical protein BC826DRAFT_135572 [Russula brevipes]|nr:hypothetical protein BC826DRAFT_135572 [Russula brevipes]
MIIRVSKTSAWLLASGKTETDVHSDATGTGHRSDATLKTARHLPDMPGAAVVHQLRVGMDKITVRRTVGSAQLMGMRASYHQPFKVYLRPRHHPTGPRTVQCFSHPVFLRGSVVLRNVGTSYLPGYTTSAATQLSKYINVLNSFSGLVLKTMRWSVYFRQSQEDRLLPSAFVIIQMLQQGFKLRTALTVDESIRY